MMPDALRQPALIEPPIRLTLILCLPLSNEKRLDAPWVRYFVNLSVYVRVMVVVGVTLM